MTLRSTGGPAWGPAAFVARWLLLGAVVLAVVAMHHVAAPDGPMAPATMTHELGAHGVAAEVLVAGVTAEPAGMDSAMHSMSHLCLAILLVVGLLLAVVLAWRAGGGRPALAGRPEGPGGARPPPWRSGRELLTATCVLRI